MAGYDVVVIGSGLGGLSAAVMLAKEGLRVLVVEQHRVVGGCLQSFRRGEYLLDTGIHYVGSLAEGRILNQYFRYLGVMDRLQLQRLDDAGYDHIHLHDGTTYRHAAGYENYVEELAAAFPHEWEGLKAFWKNVAGCLVFFVALPALIYYLSYLPYGRAAGVTPFSGAYFKIVSRERVP